MTILELQRRYRELGRLRIGATVEGSEGRRSRPVRLQTWRMTSPSRELLEHAAELWGGQVTSWETAPTEGEQWELITDREVLEVLVPPQDLEGRQFLELWSGSGVKRRCDGDTELISGRPCLCDPAARDCAPVTHLLVMLPELPDIGIWRVVTHSWNAGAELPGTVDLLRKLAAKGAIPRASIRIEARTIKREGRTQHFNLPVLEVPWSLAQAEREGVPILTGARPAISEARPELPPDASFAHDRATWGDGPELPAAEDPPDGGAAGMIEGEGGAGSAAMDPAPSPSVGSSVVAGVREGPSVPSAAEPQGPLLGGGQPEGLEAEEGEGIPVPEPSEAPQIGSGWTRYNTALLGLPRPDLAPAICRKLVRAEGWGWPPDPTWPTEQLVALAEVLEAATDAPRLEGT